MKTFIREALITVLLALAIFFAARATIQTYEVFQTCMEPNVFDGQRVVVSKIAYWGFVGEPERGDVIIFDPPFASEADFIKRVIGMPGDTVEVKELAVYVNGVRLDEPYVKYPARYTMAMVTVPEGEYFVLGDNRNNANDSHNWGFVPRENIKGKAWLSTWPPDLWGIVHDYPLGKQLAAASSQSTTTTRP